MYTPGKQPNNTSNLPDKIWREFKKISSYTISSSSGSVATLSALQALPVGSYPAGYIVEMAYRSTAGDGGGGAFYWDSSNQSTNVSADTQHGIYVPPSSDLTGASGAWVRLNIKFVTPEMFGATGGTDDTTAISAAKTSGYDVKLSDGVTYTCTSLTFNVAGQKWSGSGTLKLKNSTNSTFISISAANVLLDGIKIDNNGANQSSGGIGVYITGSKCIIKDCEIYNALGNNVLASGATYFALLGNEIYGSMNAGTANVVLQNGSSRSVIDRNYIHSSVDGDGMTVAYGGAYSNYLSIKNNRFMDNGTTATAFRSGLKVTASSDSDISGNICTGNNDCGIILSPNSTVGCNRVSVVGNVCNSTGNGIIVDNYSQDITIGKNVCCNNSADGIDVNDINDYILEGNICISNGEKGILSWGSQRGTIANNVCKNNNTVGTDPLDSGIEIRAHPTTLSESQYITIIGNTCIDNQGTKTQASGIRIKSNSQYIRVIENNLASNKTQGVLFADTATNNIAKDNVGTVVDSSSGSNAIMWAEKFGGTLTIAAGAITIDGHEYYSVDTESAAATDDLDTINGATYIGQRLTLVAANGARTVVCKDATGNLQLNADFSLDNTQDTITLVWNNGNWLQVSTANNGV